MTASISLPPLTASDLSHLENADSRHAVPIVDRVWWVGHIVEGDPFQCHVYLVEQGDRSVLLDLGSGPSFPHVRRKVEEVVPFDHVRWFVCQHQDPDVCGALPLLSESKCHPEAHIVTHWRCESIIKHYGVDLPFFRIEQNDWRLELEDRALEFVLTPYLHFPGAFVSFDRSSGVLFSSDLFGGFTGEPSLLATSVEYFEAMRLFHEHYMPSTEILQHGLSRLEGKPIRAIAPQHGSIIPEPLVAPLTERLSRLECGLLRLVETQTDVRKLTEMNRALRRVNRALTTTRSFQELVEDLTEAVCGILPVERIELFGRSDEDVLLFDHETSYEGGPASEAIAQAPEWQIAKSNWAPAGCLRGGEHDAPRLVVPLYAGDAEWPHGIAVLYLDGAVDMGEITQRILREISGPIGVAVERQVLLRQLDQDRAKFRRMSIIDQLTGLPNRYMLEEASRSLVAMHARGQLAEVAVSMYDLDHFKRVNDTFGHAAGDEVLRRVGAIMQAASREGDMFFRVGGEELVSLHVFDPAQPASQRCPDGSESCEDSACAGACLLAERIRGRIEAEDFEPQLRGHRVTVSVGVTRLRAGEGLEAALRRADRALYAAKGAGRNRVVFEG